MPDGNEILTNSRDNTLKLIDVRTFKVLSTLECDEYTNGHDCNTASISPNGRYVAVGSKKGSLIIFNIQDKEVEEVYDKEHTTSIVGCSWQKRGGSRIATIDSLGNLFIWEWMSEATKIQSKIEKYHSLIT